MKKTVTCDIRTWRNNPPLAHAAIVSPAIGVCSVAQAPFVEHVDNGSAGKRLPVRTV